MCARSSMSRADTWLPAASTPEARGISSRALADRALSSRLLIWLPVLSAHHPHSSPPAPSMPCTGHLPYVSVARWYSGRSWSSLMGAVVRAHTRRSAGWPHPLIFLSTGSATRLKHTKEDTGLPGSPNTSSCLPPSSSRVAKVSGLPGFMSTRPKWMTPWRSSSGLMRSRSPMDTPPEVTSTSTPASMAALRHPARWPSVSLATPRSVTLHPACAAAASSMERLASRIWPGPSTFVDGSTTSSPVDSTATWGLRYTSNCSTAPTVARMPTSATPTRSPACSTTAPCMMSDPMGRMSCPALAAFRMRTRLGPEPASTFSVSSTCTTASAPGGTGAPVVM
mmetsp:Transcript_19337/g.49198  ORF Transcript_19337/g.49198 Transcript_19337/m.49198 type:complete len:338 (-) Transcript_19337:281-1294(-)